MSWHHKKYRWFCMAFLACLGVCATDVFASDKLRSLTSIPKVGDGPVDINVALLVVDVQEINTAKQSLKGKVYIQYSWQDDRLSHSEPSSIKRPLTEVWHPQIQLLNLQRSWNALGSMVSVSPKGRVNYIQGMWGEFSQRMQLQVFPFDEQVFQIKLVAAGYTEEQVAFHWQKEVGGISSDVIVSDWLLGSLFAEALVYKPMTSSAGHAAITFSFAAERKQAYYVIKVIVPLVMIVIMSWVVFWIDPKEAGTNIGVSMTSMLTLIAYRFSISTFLPNLSYLTSLDYFVMVSSLLVFCSFVEVVYATHINKKGLTDASLKTDRACRLLFPIIFMCIMLETLYLRWLV